MRGRPLVRSTRTQRRYVRSRSVRLPLSRPAGPLKRRGHPGEWSVSHCLLVHMFLHRYLGERPTILAPMAANPKFLNPLLLDVGLSARRTDKHSLFVQDLPFCLHGRRSPLLSAETHWPSGWHTLAAECNRLPPPILLCFCSPSTAAAGTDGHSAGTRRDEGETHH